MPASRIIVSIFLASPGDVKPERHLVESLINEWNTIHSRRRGLLFELISWENSTAPDVAAYPQDAVNTQIDDIYDVLLAVFWSRVGPPTEGAASGTIEELNKALDRQNKYGSCRVSVFFKSAPIEIDEIDIDQVKELRKYKKTFSDRGGYYKPFSNNDDLKFEINLLLEQIYESYADRGGEAKTPRTQPLISEVNQESGNFEDDLGLFDFLDSIKDNAAHITGIAMLWSNQISKFGDDLDVKTNEIELYRNLPDQLSQSKMRASISEVCDLMDVLSQDFSDKIEGAYIPM